MGGYLRSRREAAGAPPPPLSSPPPGPAGPPAPAQPRVNLDQPVQVVNVAELAKADPELARLLEERRAQERARQASASESSTRVMPRPAVPSLPPEQPEPQAPAVHDRHNVQFLNLAELHAKHPDLAERHRAERSETPEGGAVRDHLAPSPFDEPTGVIDRLGRAANGSAGQGIDRTGPQF